MEQGNHGSQKDLGALLVASPRTPKEFEEYYDLRWRILRAPWQQPRGSEKDDWEHLADHVSARDPGGRLLGVAVSEETHPESGASARAKRPAHKSPPRRRTTVSTTTGGFRDMEDRPAYNETALGETSDLLSAALDVGDERLPQTRALMLVVRSGLIQLELGQVVKRNEPSLQPGSCLAKHLVGWVTGTASRLPSVIASLRFLRPQPSVFFIR